MLCQVKIRAAPALSTHTRTLYAAGVAQNTNLSPPCLRCPRHLRSTCEICVETGGKSAATSHRRARSESLSNAMGHDSIPRGGHLGAECGGITGWRDGSGIGSGLARPGAGGSILRRAPSINGAGSGSTNSLELIPRFLRLSALVAIELGNEADEGYTPENNEQKEGEDIPLRDREQSSANKQAHNRIYSDALRPSSEWYMLLAGLLTRATLEGYVTARWRGPDAAECLLSCGLGLFHVNGERGAGHQDESQRQTDTTGAHVDQFEQFEPDELPTLEDAAKILFPSLRSIPLQRKDGTEAEFEMEMHARLRKVSKPTTSCWRRLC